MRDAPLGHYPTPYGVTIPVFGNPDNADDIWHDLDGCMTMAGIHGEPARARCKAAVSGAMGRGGFPFQLLLDHGGRMVPKVVLPRPREAVYPKLPRDMEMDIPIENWVTLTLDHSWWNDRADALLSVLDSNIEQTKTWGAPPEILAIGLQHLLTAALEHLAEPEIECLEAAAFYALTMHEEWRSAGVVWLAPFSRTWFADWTALRPGYRRFAALCRSVDPDLPAWIAG